MLYAPLAVTTATATQPAIEAIMKKKTVREERYESNREYKFDTAMKQAAERARACHPKLIGIASNVPDSRRPKAL